MRLLRWKHASSIPRVFVGMSGGVDSSVTALLLRKQGYDVHGVFMRNWDTSDEIGSQACPADEDYLSAKRVCDQLSIPLRVMDFVADYWTMVFEPFLGEYARVRCVSGSSRHGRMFIVSRNCCNLVFFVEGHRGTRPTRTSDATNKSSSAHFATDAWRKEQTTLQQVRQPWYDQCLSFRVTVGRHFRPRAVVCVLHPGHYANVVHSADSSSEPPWLLHSSDPIKDQTYFLSLVQREQFRQVLFPLAGYRKESVRALAAAHGLSSASRRDSYGICFVGKRNFRSFLGNYLQLTPGEFRDVATGHVMGALQRRSVFFSFVFACQFPRRSYSYFSFPFAMRAQVRMTEPSSLP